MTQPINESNTMKNFLGGSSFGDSKLSKENELNESMSIKPMAQDEYESKIKNLTGGSN